MPPLIERYRDLLPVSDDTQVVSLGEGSTPLIRMPRLSERIGVELWVKWEGANPTGSFKDRGMTVAVSKAVEAGSRGIVCASTGNTAASCAAYAARAAIEAVIVFPEGAVASSKLVQVLAVGARLHPVQGTFGDAYDTALEIAEREGYAHVNSTNPYRIEGQKTASFEVIEQLGGVPGVLVLPYGGGGNTKAYARGFAEAGEGMPRIHPVQAAERRNTIASAIRIADPIHRAEVEEATASSGGSVVTVTEDELISAWHLLAHEEGLFCEPASAAGIAGLLQGCARPGERVVCVVTGHGLKDPEAVERLAAPR